MDQDWAIFESAVSHRLKPFHSYRNAKGKIDIRYDIEHPGSFHNGAFTVDNDEVFVYNQLSQLGYVVNYPDRSTICRVHHESHYHNEEEREIVAELLVIKVVQNALPLIEQLTQETS
jgi:hypothetical protein